MAIAELTAQESLTFLAGTHLGRLATSRDMQPYVVPIYFSYADKSLYSFSMPGRKIDWMRLNPMVCVEAEQMSREQWTTVVLFGRYKELQDNEKMFSERSAAVELLQKRPEWWLPGIEKPSGSSRLPQAVAMKPVFFRIDIVEISGRRGGRLPAGSDADGVERQPSR